MLLNIALNFNGTVTTGLLGRVLHSNRARRHLNGGDHHQGHDVIKALIGNLHQLTHNRVSNARHLQGKEGQLRHHACSSQLPVQRTALSAAHAIT